MVSGVIANVFYQCLSAASRFLPSVIHCAQGRGSFAESKQVSNSTVTTLIHKGEAKLAQPTPCMRCLPAPCFSSPFQCRCSSFGSGGTACLWTHPLCTPSWYPISSLTLAMAELAGGVPAAGVPSSEVPPPLAGEAGAHVARVLAGGAGDALPATFTALKATLPAELGAEGRWQQLVSALHKCSYTQRTTPGSWSRMSASWAAMRFSRPVPAA